MNTPPVGRLIRMRTSGLRTKKVRRCAAPIASIKHQIVPIVINVAPSARNARVLDALEGSTTCGRRARKKSATLGLSTLLRTPWLNTDQVLPGALPVKRWSTSLKEPISTPQLRNCERED